MNHISHIRLIRSIEISSREVGKQSSELRIVLLNEGLCENLYHITIRSVRLNLMKGGVRVYITQQ